MKNFLLYSIVFIFQSCIEMEEPSIIEKPVDETVNLTQATINRIQGTYSNCFASLTYDGFYELSHLLITSKYVTIESSSHVNNDCSDETAMLKETFKFHLITENVSEPNLLNLDLKVVSVEFRPDIGWYVSQNYCGMTTWAVGVYKDITGLSCPTFLSTDPFHTEISSTDDIKYTSLKIIDGGLEIISGYSESGDSTIERQVTDFVTVQKL